MWLNCKYITDWNLMEYSPNVINLPFGRVSIQAIYGDGDGLPSGYVKIAIENGHRNSEFSH